MVSRFYRKNINYFSHEYELHFKLFSLSFEFYSQKDSIIFFNCCVIHPRLQLNTNLFIIHHIRMKRSIYLHSHGQTLKHTANKTDSISVVFQQVKMILCYKKKKKNLVSRMINLVNYWLTNY